MQFRSTIQRQHTRPNGSSHASKPKPVNNLIAAVIDVMINLPVMHEVWSERRALKQLSNEQLNDIGIHSYHAQIECNRYFYDIPFARRKRAKEIKVLKEFGAKFIKPFEKRRF